MKKKPDNLAAWLTDPRTAKFFGRSFLVRADVLAHLLTGRGTLSDIGRVHGLSRQAVHKHARQARQIFSIKSGKPSTVS